INHEGRITNNISQFHFAYADNGVTYVVNKHLAFSASYVFVVKRTTRVTSSRHQFYLDFTLKEKISQVKIYWRSMFQNQLQDLYSSDNGDIPDYYSRNKLTVKYFLETFPYYKFTPYISTEWYYRVSNWDDKGARFNRARYFLGCFYELNKKNSVELY